jgi:hypothetical protein
VVAEFRHHVEQIADSVQKIDEFCFFLSKGENERVNMGEFSIFHWVIVLAILLFFTGIPLVLAFWIGKRIGDRRGYIRGYTEGQQSAQGK